jgi:hypothetical protein
MEKERAWAAGRRLQTRAIATRTDMSFFIVLPSICEIFCGKHRARV